MSEDNLTISVRPIFRFLGIVICAGGFFVLYDILTAPKDIGIMEKYSFVVAIVFTCPVILISCVLGRVPFFITNRLSQDVLNDMRASERLFLDNSPKNTIFAIVFLTIVLFYFFVTRFS